MNSRADESEFADRITPEELAQKRVEGDVVVVDVRRQVHMEEDGTRIPGSLRGEPESIDAWAGTLPSDKPIIVYCVLGGSVSRTVTPALRASGLDARYLVGGLDAWKEFGGEVVSLTPADHE